MPLGIGRTDFTLESGAPVAAVRCVAGPTRPRPSNAENDVAWRLISHLSLNYLTLADSDPQQGAVALRELLRLYVDPNDAAGQKQVDGLLSVRTQAATRRIPLSGPIAFGRGVEIVLIDPWNELDRARKRDELMTDYIGRCLMLIKDFCRTMNAIVVVVAHPTKGIVNTGGKVVSLADIEGSMNWYNKCDNGLIVVRESGPNTQDAQERFDRAARHVHRAEFQIVRVISAHTELRRRCVAHPHAAAVLQIARDHRWRLSRRGWRIRAHVRHPVRLHIECHLADNRAGVARQIAEDQLQSLVLEFVVLASCHRRHPESKKPPAQ